MHINNEIYPRVEPHAGWPRARTHKSRPNEAIKLAMLDRMLERIRRGSDRVISLSLSASASLCVRVDFIAVARWRSRSILGETDALLCAHLMLAVVRRR